MTSSSTLNDIIVENVATEVGCKPVHATTVLEMLRIEELSVPFIARYRKEKTGSMRETMIRALRDRYQTQAVLQASVERFSQAVTQLAERKPELKKNLAAVLKSFADAKTKTQLDDLYAPYRPKRQTKASVAKEKGYETLLEKLLEDSPEQDFGAICLAFLDKKFPAPETEEEKERAKTNPRPNVEDVLQGCRDIFAERIQDNPSVRASLRKFFLDTAVVKSAENKKFTQKDVDERVKRKHDSMVKNFSDYFEYQEALHKIPSHRLLALRRGQTRKVLKLEIEVDPDQVKKLADSAGVIAPEASVQLRKFYEIARDDSLKRLIYPLMENQVRLSMKEKSDGDAIRVFTENLKNLLMLPPIPTAVVMGIDPGYKTGCKIAVVSQAGGYLASEIVKPNPKNPEADASVAAADKIKQLIKLHSVEYIAIGNGTGSREINQLVVSVLKSEKFEKSVVRLIVNESGASIYSTSELAGEEFPDLDPTIRSAVSIARRLQDPLSELVKIDPKSIGVGQYQHDLPPASLDKSLGEVVESCVNRVGVNLNTASSKLLCYVSGIKENMARNIESYRSANGSFTSRSDLLKVDGVGSKTYEQAAGFLRISDGANPLDNTGVHPERYDVVQKIASDSNMSVGELLGNRDALRELDMEKYVDDQVGMPTLKDMMFELQRPGRDPRVQGSRMRTTKGVDTWADLKMGMVLQGTVTNVTSFGAFVNVGIHEEGLVHISEISNKFIQDPTSMIPVGSVVRVKVTELDNERSRLGLSIKQAAQSSKREGAGRSRGERSGDRSGERRPGSDQRNGQSSGQNGRSPQNRAGSSDRKRAFSGKDRKPSRGKPGQGQKSNRPFSVGHKKKQQDKKDGFSIDDLMSKFGK